jgi:hypothetical protein
MTMPKKCPHCGSYPYEIGEMEITNEKVYGGCSNEDCPLYDTYPTITESRWNSRPLEDELQRKIDKLIAFVKKVETVEDGIGRLSAEAWRILHGENE